MKVVKYGNKTYSTDWTYKLTCRPDDKSSRTTGCDAELEINHLDIYKVVARTADHIRIAFYTKCPICGEQLLVPYSDIPKDLNFKNKEEWLLAKKEALITDLFELDTTDLYRNGIKAFCEDIGIEPEELTKY